MRRNCLNRGKKTWDVCVILFAFAFFSFVECVLSADASDRFPFNLKSMIKNTRDREDISLYMSTKNEMRGIPPNLMTADIYRTHSFWESYALNETATSHADMEFEFKIRNEWEQNTFGKYQALADDSFTITMMAVGAIGVLYVSPDSFSNWEDKDLSPAVMGERYSHKVGDGPVVDKDADDVNFIGHPYFGGAYYIHARKLGYQRDDAFIFSFLMSTCMYEYGVEAFFERPSMQDLVFTPIAGSLVGELMMWGERSVKANNSQVLGSKTVGHICLVLMDPIGSAIKNIDRMTAIFPNTHVKTRFFAYQYRTSDGGEYPGGQGGSRDFRCGIEIQWFRD